eukprot:32516-Chlamydomonas_euryale.AAC.1
MAHELVLHAVQAQARANSLDRLVKFESWTSLRDLTNSRGWQIRLMGQIGKGALSCKADEGCVPQAHELAGKWQGRAGRRSRRCGPMSHR